MKLQDNGAKLGGTTLMKFLYQGFEGKKVPDWVILNLG